MQIVTVLKWNIGQSGKRGDMHCLLVHSGFKSHSFRIRYARLALQNTVFSNKQTDLMTL